MAIFALAERLPTSATLPFGLSFEKILAQLWSSFFLTYHPIVWWLWVATDSYWIFRKREWTSAREWERCYKLLHNTSLCSPLLLNQLVWKGIHQISCLRDLFIWIALRQFQQRETHSLWNASLSTDQPGRRVLSKLVEVARLACGELLVKASRGSEEGAESEESRSVVWVRAPAARRQPA